MEILNYPKHCIGCHKEKDCQQKKFMNAGTESTDGYADYELADWVCCNCLDNTHNSYPMENEEVDSPAHCSICGCPLTCRLTDAGIEYVKEALDGKGCCQELWPVLFADYL